MLGTSAAALALFVAKNIIFLQAAILPVNRSMDARQPVDEMIYADPQPESDLINVNAEIVQKSIPEILPAAESAMSSKKSRHYLVYSAHAPKNICSSPVNQGANGWQIQQKYGRILTPTCVLINSSSNKSKPPTVV